MSVVQLKPAQAEPRDVVAGDHVYYRHAEHGPQAGEVTAAGKDGFLCAHGREGGGMDKVRWDAFLGHKARRQRKFVLTDRGEDGALARTDGGEVVYVRGEVPEVMGKAHPAVAAAFGQDGEAVRLALLDLAAAQVEQAAVLAAAIDRLAQAMAAQAGRLDALVEALQPVAPAMGVLDADSVLQVDQAAGAATGFGAI